MSHLISIIIADLLVVFVGIQKAINIQVLLQRLLLQTQYFPLFVIIVMMEIS